MRVLNVSHLADTGGNGWRTAQAFRRHAPDVEYRFTARQRNWLRYPEDLPWDQAREAWELADVVHVRDGFHAQARLAAPDRPTVIHHHGTQFRLHRDELLREQRARGAIGLAATLDLYLMAPDELTWAPALYDLDWLGRQADRQHDGVFRVAHAPTNRTVKSTDAFLSAVRRLNAEIPVEVVLVERTAWAECIRRKARADVYFDQVGLGYGNNAIEAWGMGQAVIAGGAPETLAEMVRRFDSLPFYLADEGTIYEALRRLADPVVRAAWAHRGMIHARQYHDEAAGVRFLRGVYEQALARQAVAA